MLSCISFMTKKHEIKILTYKPVFPFSFRLSTTWENETMDEYCFTVTKFGWYIWLRGKSKTLTSFTLVTEWKLVRNVDI